MSNQDIENFWNWFYNNCQKFGKRFENTMLLRELDTHIQKLGDFSWEVGPGIHEDNALTISPNGDIDLLKETRQIIKQARNCTGWEYYYAKPPKTWNLAFSLQTDTKKNIEINASEWKYVLLRYDDGLFEIIIKAPELSQFSWEDKMIAVEIVLDGIIGEEDRMLLIDGIDVVDEFEDEFKSKASDIKHLADHFLSLKKDTDLAE